MSIKYFFSTLIIVSLISAYEIKTSISSDSLMVGDKVDLRIMMIVPTGMDVTDNTEEVFKDPIYLKDSQIARFNLGSSDSLIFNYQITSYTYDTMTVNPITYNLKLDSLTDTLKSDPIPLRLISAIQAEEGDTIRMKDIKGPLKAGKPSLLWLWILLGIIGAIIITIILFNKLKKDKEEQLPPPLPPYEEAMKALSSLDRKELIEKGERRQFVFELSEILKRYAGRRYDVNFPEFTTEEIMEWLNKTAIIKDASDILKIFFEETHMIKFAKYTPDITSSRELREKAIKFIKVTRPAEEVTNKSVEEKEESK